MSEIAGGCLLLHEMPAQLGSFFSLVNSINVTPARRLQVGVADEYSL